MALPRSTRLNWTSIIWSIASRQNSPSTTIGTASAMPTIVNALRSGRPAKLRIISTRRGFSALADSKPSIQDRRKRRGAAGRIATAGARATTFCNAVTTPSDAAARLIKNPTKTAQGVSSKTRAGKRKNP